MDSRVEALLDDANVPGSEENIAFATECLSRFDAGDHATLRGSDTSKQKDHPAIAAAILDRLRVPPIVTILFAICIAALIWIMISYV